MSAGRNDPCPCGSGRKYKDCCRRHDESVFREEQLSGIVTAHNRAPGTVGTVNRILDRVNAWKWPGKPKP